MQLHACIWKGLIEQTHHQSAFSNPCSGRILHMYDRKNMCNGVLMVCFKLFGARQSYIADILILSCCVCADALKLTRPLCRLMLICVTNQSIEWPPKTSNREECDLNNQAIGGKSNPVRQGTLAWALRFCTNWFHASAMKRGWISIR